MIQDFVVKKSEANGCFINNGIQMPRCKLYTYAWVLEQAYVIWRIVSLDGEHIICYDVLYQLKNNWIQYYISHICYKMLLIVYLNHLLTYRIITNHLHMSSIILFLYTRNDIVHILVLVMYLFCQTFVCKCTLKPLCTKQ